MDLIIAMSRHLAAGLILFFSLSAFTYAENPDVRIG